MKRTLGILLAIMMILSTVSFAAPQMVGVVDTAKEESNAAEGVLEAQTSLNAETTVVPGINLITGTKNPLDFNSGKVVNKNEYAADDGTKLLEKVQNYSEFSVVSSPITGDTNNNVLKITPVTYYNGECFPTFVPTAALPADGRPVFINFKTALLKGDIVATFVAKMGNTINNSASGYLYMSVYKSNAATTAWKNVAVKDSASTTKNAVTTLYFKTTTGAAPTENEIVPEVYVDDIMYVPYYKVTYKNGDEVLDTVYVLDDGKGNILDSFIPTEQGVALPEGKNGWALTDGGRAVKKVALENKDIELYAVYHDNFTPGINMLTGTEEPYDFSTGTGTATTYLDEDGEVLLKRINGYIEFSAVDSPVSGDNGNKALKLTPIYYMNNGGCYPDFYPIIELPSDKRPVFVSFKSVVTNGDELNWFDMDIGINKARGKQLGSFRVTPVLSGKTANAWTKYYTKDNLSTTGPAAINPSFLTKTKATMAEDGTTVITPAIENAQIIPEIYIDDLMYVPYYKVTYMNGTENLGYAYVLDDGVGNIMEYFDPLKLGVECPEGTNGWALTDGGEKAARVALENEDIVLYAVAGAPDSTDSLIYSYEFNSEEEVSHFDRNESSSVIPYYDNGNAVFHKDVQKADGTWQGDSRLVFTSSSMPKLNFSKIKRIVVRIKATALDYAQKSNGDGTYTPVAFDWTGTDLATELGKTNLQMCANISSSWKYPISQSFSTMTPDEDGYYLFDVDTTASTAGLETYPTLFLLLIHQKLEAPVKFEVDYIRLYGTSGAEFSPAVNAPQKREGFGLRVDSAETTGVRFRAAISNDLRAKAELAEYGWIVALADVLGENELTHDFKLDNGKTAYVTGKNYCKAENLDKIYETEESNTVFTAVVTGVPVEYASRYLVVRPYSVVGGAYVYGESLITCPRDVGQKLYDKWVAAGSPEGDTKYDYVKYKDYIDTLGIKK